MTKPEIRMNDEFQMTNDENQTVDTSHSAFGLRHSSFIRGFGFRHSFVIRHSAFLLLSVIAASAHADDWSLTTADFQTQPAQLKTLSPRGINITSSDTKADRTIPLDQFVSIQRPAIDNASTPKYTLILSNGDRLIGEPGSVASEKLTWISPTLGKVPVPFNQLVAIGKGGNVMPPQEAPKQDLVTLANGDTAAGVFVNCGDGNVTLQEDAGPATIPLASVTRIAFASTGSNKADTARAFRIHLIDGSIVTVPDAGIDGDQLKLTMPGNNASIVSLPLRNVIGIEQTNGPVGWLSSHAPSENIQTPYLGGASLWPARFDRSVDGSPLSFEGKTYDYGIGVHAYSRLTFIIDPQWRAFRTQYAIESHRDDPAKFADVTVRVKLDGKTVHEQQHFRAGVLSPVITVDLKGASTLTLECDFGQAGDTQAHLDWLEPALLRTMPVPSTMPAAP